MVQSQNLRRTRDLLLPRPLSGQIDVDAGAGLSMSEVHEDVSDEDFNEQLVALNEGLEVLNAQALELQTRIAQNVGLLLS